MQWKQHHRCWILQQESACTKFYLSNNTSEPLLCVLPFLNIELQIWNASHPRNVFVGSWMWRWISLSVDWIWVHTLPPEGWAVCTICMGWPITLAQPIQDITQHIASTLTRPNGMNIMTQGESCVVKDYVLFICSELCAVWQLVCAGCGTCEGREKKVCFGIFVCCEPYSINVTSRGLCGCTFLVLVSVVHILTSQSSQLC